MLDNCNDQGLISRLEEMNNYIDDVVSKKLPVNHMVRFPLNFHGIPPSNTLSQIVRQIQEIFNLIPNLNSPELLSAFMVKTNDNMLAIYVASLVRAVTTLHDLINNKIELANFESGSSSFYIMPVLMYCRRDCFKEGKGCGRYQGCESQGRESRCQS